MASRNSSKRNQRSSKAKARRRRRAVGMGGSAGAFLALGLGPLATAPAAHADPFDVILDPIINSITSALPSALDPLAGLDLASLTLPAADLAGTSGVGLGAVDSALVLPTDALAAAGSSADPLAASGSFDPLSVLGSFDPLSVLGSSDPLSALGSSFDPSQLFNELIYQPFETVSQAWITSPIGEPVDNVINTAWQDVTGQSSILIGNGADGTITDPTGGNGGLLFGDGGTGWTSTVAGEDGGAGGMAYNGDGGMGGGGYDGVAPPTTTLDAATTDASAPPPIVEDGTDGGAGGDTLFGIAGNGGA
ncbi:PGRS repeat-containing protein, partial [Mycobacterium sp.]|uniref:PGRS repeat-containing protein n=1 Tax=Mycobacterium sp. TaxID=1785 RepID=UPI003CA946E5